MNTSRTNHTDLISLAQQLAEKRKLLSSRSVAAGFDGFIDTIVKIIRQKSDDGVVHFRTIDEFGRYVSEHSAGSFSLELEEVNIKIGGNMPIMANALGSLGVAVNCIGAFGYPRHHPVFDSLSSNCKRYSFADPGTSTAYEFSNGKMMIGNMAQLNHLGWKELKERIGLHILQQIFRESDLMCMVNWSEIDASHEVWSGVINEILPSYSKPDQQIFLDLSDCSKRDDRAILAMIDQIKQFARFAKVTLGLNSNEAKKIGCILGVTSNDSIEAAQKLFDKLNISCLIIHSNQQAMGIVKNEVCLQESFFVANPVISTGAGDHFNAGFNTGKLLGFDLSACLILGHAVSGYYVRSGNSPVVEELVALLRKMSEPEARATNIQS